MVIIRFNILAFLKVAQAITQTMLYSCTVNWRIWKNWPLWQKLIQTDARFYTALYKAGVALGQNQSPNLPLEWLQNNPNPYPFSDYFSTYQAAQFLLSGIATSSRTPVKEYAALWERFSENVVGFLRKIEKNGARVLDQHRYRIAIEKIIVGTLDSSLSATVGSTHFMRIEVTVPFSDILLSSSVRQFYCTVEAAGESLGVIELPVIDGMVSRWVLSDAIAARFAWEIMTQFLERDHYPHFRQLSKAAGWSFFLQELWGAARSDSYPISKSERIEAAAPFNAMAPKIILPLYRIEVSDDVSALQVNAPAVEIVVTVGGALIGSFSLSTLNQTTSAKALQDAVSRNCGFELCRAAVREGLMGSALDHDGGSLRSRLAQAAQQTRGTSPIRHEESAAIFLENSFSNNIGTSASRWTMLPKETAAMISKATTYSGLSLESAVAKETSSYRFFSVPGPVVSTDNSSAHVLSRRPFPSTYQPPQARLGILQTGSRTDQLPILMYHHICPFDASQPKRWQLAPEDFESQLRYLSDHGFHSVALADWQQAVVTQMPLPGNAVLLTFDDGYLDFFTYAWPLLQKYGFSASVFIITDQAGVQFEGQPLMDWHQIKQLKKAGIEFGSHSAQHLSIPSLGYADMVREGWRSRITLEEKLETPVRAFCYPFGDSDPIVRHLIGACGYEMGLSLGARRSSFSDDLLNLSRIEVEGTDSIKDFASKLRVSPGQETSCS